MVIVNKIVTANKTIIIVMSIQESGNFVVQTIVIIVSISIIKDSIDSKINLLNIKAMFDSQLIKAKHQFHMLKPSSITVKQPILFPAALILITLFFT